MNANHARLCPSPERAEHLHDEILPAVTAGVDLGDEMLEIGPGPGAATEWLRQRVGRLVAVEVDPAAAGKLAARYAGTNVEVVTGDATDLTFEDGSFDAVGCFTMLHHVPTARQQDLILAEACRVLRPGGALVASDSLAGDALHRFHEGDTYNPVEPSSLLARLQVIGFAAVTVTVDDELRFVARTPSLAAAG